MRAAVLELSSQPLVVRDLVLGKLASTDVVIRIAATSLCHTDLEAADGALGCPLPLVLGHEASGIVEWIGPDVRRVSVGDHIVVSWNPHCGGCFYCVCILTGGQGSSTMADQYIN